MFDIWGILLLDTVRLFWKKVCERHFYRIMSFLHQRKMGKVEEDKASLLGNVEQGLPFNTTYERIRRHRAFQLIGELTAEEQTKLFIDFKLQFLEDLALLTEDEMGEIFPDHVLKRRRAQAVGDYIRKGPIPPNMTMSGVLLAISKPQNGTDTPQNDHVSLQMPASTLMLVMLAVFWFFIIFVVDSVERCINALIFVS
jgi:hypothetical protein